MSPSRIVDKVEEVTRALVLTKWSESNSHFVAAGEMLLYIIYIKC
jgi:hypothetical protein